MIIHKCKVNDSLKRKCIMIVVEKNNRENFNPHNLCKDFSPQVVYIYIHLTKIRQQTFVSKKDDAISAYTGMHMI